MTAVGNRGLLALAAIVFSLVLAAQSVSAEGLLTGDVPGNDRPGGVALVQWSGGSVDELAVAAEAQACRLRSTWVTLDGKFLGFILGAPTFANQGWTNQFGTSIEPRALLIVCATPGLESGCSISGLVVDHVAGAIGTPTPLEALEQWIQGVSQLPDGAPPSGTFTEASVVEATDESSASAEFELIAHDGVLVGRYFAVNYGQGWLFSGSQACSFPKAG